MQSSFILALFGVSPLTLALLSTPDHSTALIGVLSKLMEFYCESPNVTAGLFDQSISPWWESGSIFEVSHRNLCISEECHRRAKSSLSIQTYMDYAKYTGSNQFEKAVGEALVLNSYVVTHDFFGTNHTYVSTAVGRWNDDVQW
jgi:mannan endo-1,6-alpha-mannosidase